MMKNLVVLFLFTFIISACSPTPAPLSRTTASDSTTDPTDGDGLPSNTLTETNNFLQIGNTKELSQLSLFADYADSFIIRGNALNFHLSSLVGSPAQKFCLVAKYPENSTTDSKQILIMAARARSYFNPTIQQREYFLQVEVANESANTNDCLTINLQNTLNARYATTSTSYNLGSTCPNCNSNITSEGINLYDANGSIVTDIDLNHLRLGIIPPIGGATGGDTQSCTTDSACVGIGFNCCLSGQCVNHGATKEGVNQSLPVYQSAIAEILARPELIVNYQEYFYVCPTLVPTNPDNNPVDPDEDPIQQANDLFLELQEYYHCLNPVQDEFSICTKSEELVSTKFTPPGSMIFSAVQDDLTFKNLNPALTFNNITELNYAGIPIYKAKLLDSDTVIDLDPANGSINAANDALGVGNAQSVTFKMAPPANAINDTLKISYRVDGTCERLGLTLARCKKFYKQGQSSNPPRSSDHAISQSFKIPTYANTTFNLIVEVGGVNVTSGIDTWVLSNANTITFSNDYIIYLNQQVTITYFVTTNIDLLMASREEAQEKVDGHCACGEGITCNVRPVYTDVLGESEITSYECLYPPTESNAPLQKTLFMSARTVAHKFYDGNGVNYEYENISGELSQECAVATGDESTCTKFQYTNDDPSRPNNQSYIGFNEILGSFGQTEKSPIPATKVDVVRGRLYDIFADTGVFSSCIGCGKDYYSNLQKIFPDNFATNGGGYLPDYVESSRELNRGKYNADDMKFGRACFVPPTMIPWTHKANDSVTQQRRDRLKAQHFMFANGYNKDWYGFDYGSLIGSFDGVKWFSIGNQRRISATSNKLYLAINAYFGDVTANNTFKIVVSETASVNNSGSIITHDTESDGAECQQAHFCSTDNDCIANLGYDYTCQNVSALSTPWPIFDANANEVSGSGTLNLLSIVKGSNGQSRRCVYRGRGALCKTDLTSLSSSNTFASTDVVGLNSCSHNTYCAELDTNKFNHKISRFGITAANQNNLTYITDDTDTVGLAARILGRPYEFYGNESAPAGVEDHLTSLNADGLCIPGKSPELISKTLDLNTASNDDREADKIFGIGRTLSSLVVTEENYYAACPATNESGKFTGQLDFDLNAPQHSRFAIAQNISSNALQLSSFDELNLFNDESTLVTTKGYHKNTCMRAPGASCFTNLDCAPNNFISGKVKTVTDFLGLNEAEQEFWKEELVCGNGQDRYQPNDPSFPNPAYDTSLNRCCRETDKQITYYSQDYSAPIFTAISDSTATTPVIPGKDISLNSNMRYSRVHTTYDKQLNDDGSLNSDYPPLSKANNDTGTAEANKKPYLENILRQYNTLHLNNARVCCTGSWVRQMDDGGHKFSGTSGQDYSVEDFKYLNWFVNNDPDDLTPFECLEEDLDTPSCEIRKIAEGSDYEQKTLNWLGKFELLGIPQVLIETNLTQNDGVDADQSDDVFVIINETQDAIVSGSAPVLKGTIKRNGTAAFADAKYNNTDYYSAANMSNFDNTDEGGPMKKIFSENKFNCCIPAGPAPSDTTNSECCTGQFTTVTANTGVTGPRCCLPGNTDVTVYTNRYVSSEGATLNGQPINDNDVDKLTGYLKKEIVLQLATQMCCSGQATFGSAIGTFPDFIDEAAGVGSSQESRRFIQSTTADQPESSIFASGRKWNNHVYCLDSATDGGGTIGGQ